MNDCEEYVAWLCENCEPEKCASYTPKGVKPKLEVNKDNQLTLFDL